MIRSMTGFGDASIEEGGLHFAVELRSLNNRYFKAVIRLPEEVSGLETLLETLLRKRVSRGSFTLTVKCRRSDTAVSQINDQALMEYLDHLETIRGKVQDQAVQIDLTRLLALPGVMRPTHGGDAIHTHAERLLPQLLGQAVDRLIEMRLTEGRALAEDLLLQIGVIDSHMQRIGERAPVVINEYHQKLAQRVEHLMARAKLKVDEKDLIREVAVFADRADISEELSRMSGHLDQFREIVGDGEAEDPAGRTLDFIAQEMLREANTIGSKSNDATISRSVVEVKSRIDRIKEQVQNVE